MAKSGIRIELEGKANECFDEAGTISIEAGALRSLNYFDPLNLIIQEFSIGAKNTMTGVPDRTICNFRAPKRLNVRSGI